MAHRNHQRIPEHGSILALKRQQHVSPVPLVWTQSPSQLRELWMGAIWDFTVIHMQYREGMGKRIGHELWSISLPVLSRSVEMGSHYWLMAVQWPVWNEEVVSVQFPCGQVSLTSKPPPALAVPGSSACTPWTGGGASTVQWLQRSLHAGQDAGGFECFWHQQLCSFLQTWLVLWLSCFGDLLKTSPGFSAPVWTQHSHWFPRSRAFRSAQISAVADGSSIPARMAWWSSHAEHWQPMTPARAIWRAG